MVGERTAPSVRVVCIRRQGVRRTLAVLAAPVRVAYVRLGALVAPAVEGALADLVMANRVAGSCVDPPILTLRPWRLERRMFTHALERFASIHRCAAVADVHACYASIGPALARASLERIGATHAEEIEAFLRSLERAGVSGLPVGPDPSAVIANAVLSQVDDALVAEGFPHLRWVDDLVIGAPDPPTAARGLDVIRDTLHGLGLRACPSKTRVLPDAAALMASTARSPRGRAGPVG